MNNIAICLSSDNNYVQHLGATISSVLKNKNDDEFINVYIIDGGISDENKAKLNSFQNKFDCKIEYVFPDLDKLKNCITYKGDYISLATYYRLLIPEMVMEERVIYLDCDIIVRKSLKALYEKDFTCNLVLGSEDVSSEVHKKRLELEKYVNAGVLLMNTKQMREENTVSRILDWLANNIEKVDRHDQDVINASINDRIDYVEDIYNVQVRRKNMCKFDKIEDPAILHFISGQKPWTLYKPLNYTKWEGEYFEALKDTPWESFIQEYKEKSKAIFLKRFLYPTGIFSFILQNLFSVKNSDDRNKKIITVLFIPFVINKKKKIK